MIALKRLFTNSHCLEFINLSNLNKSCKMERTHVSLYDFSTAKVKYKIFIDNYFRNQIQVFFKKYVCVS